MSEIDWKIRNDKEMSSLWFLLGKEENKLQQRDNNSVRNLQSSDKKTVKKNIK